MKLRLSKDLTLPLDAATESFAILGRRGSGKTHTAVVMAEEMLKAGVQVVVIDPLDVWWGLRVSKDGKTAGFPIYVAGGSHADIPLSADAGKVLADAVVDQGLSIVLSTRHLSKSDQRRFVGDFCERLYDRKADPKHRTALHVDIDEADAFVPQRLMPGAERCFGAVDTLVRRGRSSGLAVTLISQRPQVINKDVLSQTEVLVSHQLTGPQDRKALQAWIEANDDENRSAEFMGALASLPKGRAWFWSPGLLKVFKPVDVRDRETFDSSATPKPGVVGVKPKAFAAVDLDKLTAEIAATIEKAKADDPRELRKQIAELQRQVKTASNYSQIIPTAQKSKEIAVLTDADRALIATVGVRLTAMENELAGAQVELLAEHLRAAEDSLRRVWGQFEGIHQTERAKFSKLIDSKGFQKILGKLSAVQPVAAPSPARAAVGRPHAAVAPLRDPAQARQANGDDEAIGGGLRRILIALAQRPVGLTLRQIGVRAALSSKSGTFSTYMSRGRQQGWIQDGGKGGPSVITPAGLAALGAYEPLSAGADLLRYWLGELGGGAARILESVAAAYPETLTLEQIGERANLNHQSGTFSTYMSRLRTLELVESGRGWVRASAELFS